jgi:tetratricopeptide (TPR) repeat protein
MPERRPPPGLVAGDTASAQQLADALRAAQPRVNLLAASVLIEAGALEAAWEPISEAARSADDPRLRADLGDELLRLARGWEGRHERHSAGGALRLAARLAPERALPALARHVQREGMVEEALALWTEAIRLDPGEADHHLRRGRLLEAMGRLEEAHAAYLRLIEELPTATNALTVAPRLERLSTRLPPVPGAGIRIAMLGSATLDQLRDCLVVQAHRAGLRPRMQVARADRYTREILDAGSDLYRFAPEVLVLAIHRSRLFPGLDEVAGHPSVDDRRATVASGVDTVRTLLRAFRSRSQALVLLHGMVVPQRPLRAVVDMVDELGQRDVFHQINRELARLVATEFDGVHLVDEDAVQGRCGKAAATDPRLWLATRMPWSDSVLMPLADEHVRHLLARRDRARTCVVVGLDDTLWGGRAGADGAGGVRLGHRPPGNAFLAVQGQLARLRDLGVQLAICSRAGRTDAVTLLQTHPDMRVRLDHFAATRMGCTSTPDGVREIAAELGIGLESVVFWDGNPGERARVRAELPQVLTPEVPVDPARHRQALLDLCVFDRVWGR